jgi:3-oxoacyl-[acyl-carrier protein] reductase
MDLGISGRSALVCASSAGLGFACAWALAAEGVHVFINGRDPARLAAAHATLRASFQSVSAIVGDITSRNGRSAILEACPSPDILINNNAGPTPGAFLDFGEKEWEMALSDNMMAPLILVRAVLPGMIERRFGRIVNITSAMVTTPRAHMTLSSGSRAGLTAALKGVSLDVARHNVTINNLLPERIDTNRQEQLARLAMKQEGIDYAEARARQVKSIAANRLGRPEELGAACAFLCSATSGFISGQNLHLDGGSYPALI